MKLKTQTYLIKVKILYFTHLCQDFILEGKKCQCCSSKYLIKKSCFLVYLHIQYIFRKYKHLLHLENRNRQLLRSYFFNILTNKIFLLTLFRRKINFLIFFTKCTFQKNSKVALTIRRLKTKKYLQVGTICNLSPIFFFKLGTRILKNNK